MSLSINFVIPYAREKLRHIGKHITEELKYKKEEDEKSFVYVIKCREYYKIGFTSNIKERYLNFQHFNPLPLEMVYYKEFNNVRAIEKRLHSLFNNNRHRGEWFKLHKKELNILHRLMLK